MHEETTVSKLTFMNDFELNYLLRLYISFEFIIEFILESTFEVQ